MTDLGPAAPLQEVHAPFGEKDFVKLRETGKPCIIRGLVSHWPLVTAARQSDEAIVEYLTRVPPARPVGAIAAAPGAKGRFFYNASMTGFNFHFGQGRLDVFLADLLNARALDEPPAMAVQSEDIGGLLPHVADENTLDLLPHVRPRIWIGNRIRVAPHYDLKENIACCVAGRRRFTVFPPDQTRNLYSGPLEHTPAGAPISMVELAAPDLERYPKFTEAWAAAASGVVEPGDAIYLPYGWWHGVDSLEPVSILVNYWWNEAERPLLGSPHDALMHAVLAFKHLPPEQRAVWRSHFEHYVFQAEDDPAAHLPAHARGMLGPPSEALFAGIRDLLRRALS